MLSGGGIYSTRYLRITNSTISGNFTNGSGGGIYARTLADSILINHSTITANTADADVDGTGQGSGAVLDVQSLTIGHTIIAGNNGQAAGMVELSA